MLLASSTHPSFVNIELLPPKQSNEACSVHALILLVCSSSVTVQFAPRFARPYSTPPSTAAGRATDSRASAAAAPRESGIDTVPRTMVEDSGGAEFSFHLCPGSNATVPGLVHHHLCPLCNVSWNEEGHETK